MKIFLRNLVLLCLFPSLCLAGDAEEMQKILLSNFEAANREDVDALLDTCSVDMPDRQKLRSESLKIFKEKDIHYSLMDFRLLEIEGDYAVAKIVQKTHASDRKNTDEEERSYRNGSGLLPDADVVSYIVAFKKDYGKWKCYLTVSEPVPVENKE